MIRRLTVCFILCLHLVQSVAAKSIKDFGAIPSDRSTAVAVQNREAFLRTVEAALAEESDAERVVEVPAGEEYTMMGRVHLTDVHRLTLRVEGTLLVSDDLEAWPFVDSSYQNFIQIEDCSHVTLESRSGKGRIDGQGYKWWQASLLGYIGKGTLKSDSRPKLVCLYRCEDVLVRGLTMLNSPFWHLNLEDVRRVQILSFTVEVDVMKQKQLVDHHLSSHAVTLAQALKPISFNPLDHIPLFPLNTDGIDVSGSDVVIKDFVCTNFDDAVAVKPADGRFKFSSCSSNILVEGAKVNWGVGMTIGTVPPRESHTCVKNVTFRDVTFSRPFKAIYIKTNPGSGSGEIRNITYENIVADRASWFPIYIGPQQQKQPDGGGPGCMFYPLTKDCATQPLVSMSDITLRNVTFTRTYGYAGVVRCHESNPCKNFRWEGVEVKGMFASFLKYKCENIQGSTVHSSPSTCFMNNNKAPTFI